MRLSRVWPRGSSTSHGLAHSTRREKQRTLPKLRALEATCSMRGHGLERACKIVGRNSHVHRIRLLTMRIVPMQPPCFLSLRASPSRRGVSCTSERPIEWNQIPPNTRSMSSKNPTLAGASITSHPRNGGVKSGMSVRSSAGSLSLGSKVESIRVRFSRCSNSPMKYRTCRQDPMGSFRARVRTVGEKCPKYR